MKRFIRTKVTGTAQERDPRRPDLGGLEQKSDVHYSMYDEEPDDSVCMARVTATEDLMAEISAVGEVTVIDDAEAEKVLEKHTPHANLEDLDQPDVEIDNLADERSPEELLSREKINRARLIQEWTQKVPREERRQLLQENDVRNVGALVHKLGNNELEELLDRYGFSKVSNLPQNTSTIVRCSVAIPSRGRRVLQDQELNIITSVAQREKVQDVSFMPSDGHRMAKSDLSGSSNKTSEIRKKVKSVLDGRNTEHQEIVDWVKERKRPDWLQNV